MDELEELLEGKELWLRAAGEGHEASAEKLRLLSGIAQRRVYTRLVTGHHLLTRSEIRLYGRRHWRALKIDAKEVLYLLPADDLSQSSIGCAIPNTPCCRQKGGSMQSLVHCLAPLWLIECPQQEDLLPGGRCVALDGHTCVSIALKPA